MIASNSNQSSRRQVNPKNTRIRSLNQKRIIQKALVFSLALLTIGLLVSRVFSNLLTQIKIVTAQVSSRETLEIVASEDAHIVQEKPYRNTGGWKFLFLQNKPGKERRALVRFVISGIPNGAIITEAKLKFYVSNGSLTDGSADAAGYIAQVLGTWTEDTVTWNNAPLVGGAISEFLPNNSAVPGTFKEADVISQISGNGIYDFYLLSNSISYDGFYYTSSEATVESAGELNLPTLIVTYQTTSDVGVPVTHGPIVGGVTDTSANIFVRTEEGASVKIAYSTITPYSPQTAALSQESQTQASSDLTAIIPLSNLNPETKYYYWIAINSDTPDTSKTYEFITFPTPDSARDFNFAVFSDLSQRKELRAISYQSAANDSPSFILQIGDFDHRDPGDKPTPITLENWRKMHRDMFQDMPAGQDFATYIAPYFPLYQMWDDHDYGDNNTDRTAWWKDLATQAFKEYHPLPPLPNPNRGLWHNFHYAQAEVFMLDLRSQRDPNNDADNSEKSMLDGANIENGQKDWLKSALANSTVRWKFIISTSVWNPKSKKVDSWYLFQNEQQELVKFIQDNNITGVIILSGDIHTGGAIDNGTNSYFPELNVPTINMEASTGCTGGYCGFWSEGIVTDGDGIDPSGYALVKVEYDDSTGTDRAILQTKDKNGNLRLEYTVELP